MGRCGMLAWPYSKGSQMFSFRRMAKAVADRDLARDVVCFCVFSDVRFFSVVVASATFCPTWCYAYAQPLAVCSRIAHWCVSLVCESYLAQTKMPSISSSECRVLCSQTQHLVWYWVRSRDDVFSITRRSHSAISSSA